VNMMRSSRTTEVVEGVGVVSQSTDLPAVFTGVCAGVLSGLLGVGGGIVMVPLFRRWLGLPIKNAVATSLICVGCFAIPGTITHSLGGGIDWRFASWLTIGVVVGAPFGSSMTMKMSDKKLQRVFGLFLALIAVVYGVGEFLSL
ncbi:MAG: sulfite exporter TauE/SafE family protein, partial [Actinomycetota bacterium]